VADAPYGATVLFAAGGTGEFFSLSRRIRAVIKVAAETCKGRVPIVGGAGGGTRLAIKYAQEAERNGAHGVLLLPHYLTEATRTAWCSTSSRLQEREDRRHRLQPRRHKLTADSLLKLAERCPNLIGFKDGTGDIERMVSIRQQAGRPLRLHRRHADARGLCRTPTRRWACRCIRRPCSTSSRAPRSSSTTPTHRRHRHHGRLIDEFFLPYLAIRNKGEGYAVSIVKAGATIVGKTAGPVRPPLRPDGNYRWTICACCSSPPPSTTSTARS
jgi:5-dehydro-4-deoxyglucarate dehydratase